MKRKNNEINVTIDSASLKVEGGMTILQAAEQNNIYIPTLCSHRDLTPHGGCRMCIVEVVGMRGFPTSCTTPVEEGMSIKTDTPRLREERMEILQFILSEHTSSCLICDEKDECRNYMGTIRKVGVTTGCRYCPNDLQCELQDVVEKMDVKELMYPIHYRNLRVEREDPFYDRDYNICILCGRCIRMCQEVRTSNTLAFKRRGYQMVIGPAYGRTHMDAGCEFCGACVAVCPTGALAEKPGKWEGKPDGEEFSTCALCGVGCQIRLQVKGDEVISSLPTNDLLVNNGQLCVKGRFCMPELLNNYQRLKMPYKALNGTKVEIAWDEAIEMAAEKLSACKPDQFGMLISPSCCNEDLYVAQKFTRAVMGSHHVDTRARLFYGAALNAYLDLLRSSVPIMDIRNASTILCVGLDARFGRSVVGVELRKAFQKGAEILTIHPRHHSLSVIAEKWFQPAPGTELNLLDTLVRLTAKKTTGRKTSQPKGKAGSLKEDLSEASVMLQKARAPVILVGSEFLNCKDSTKIFEAVKKLAENLGAGIIPLPAQNNLFGSILMGVYPELLPGGAAATDRKALNRLKKSWSAGIPDFATEWNISALSSGKRMKVLYLIGEVPPGDNSGADFLIAQNIYPPDASRKADLVLPSAAFSEVNGTFINGEGRIQLVRRAVDPPGQSLPDWKILCRIARKMGKKGFDFSSVRDIQKEISSQVAHFKDLAKEKRNPAPLKYKGEMILPKTKSSGTKKPDSRFPFLLNTSIVEHLYRGLPLSNWVAGAKELFAEGIVDMNGDDAKKTGISDGDEVVVTSPGFKKTWKARVLWEQPQGVLHVTLHQNDSIGPSPHPVKIRKRNV